MESETLIGPLAKRAKIVYESGCDFTFAFQNGDTIPINRTLVVFHMDYFFDTFFGASPPSSILVRDFDSGTFKTFLDCLFGLKEYTVLDSLLIYPVAYQYQVKKSLKKCVSVLKPQILDENVALTLNLALFYNDEELENNVIKFLKDECGIIDFLENEKYRNLLEPKSIGRLVGEMKLYSFVWHMIYEWGENYLKKQGKPVDIYSFFNDVGIFSKLNLDHFESVQAIFDFHELSHKQLFDSNNILEYLKSKLLNPIEMLPNKSAWMKLEESTFTENISFDHPLGVDTAGNKGAYLEVSTNQILFEKTKQNDHPGLEIVIRYFFNRFSVPIQNAASSHNYGCERSKRGATCDCLGVLNTVTTNRSKTTKIDLNQLLDKLYFTVNLEELKNQYLEVQSVEVTYNFINVYKARIFKTELNGDFQKDNELYFTRNVELKNFVSISTLHIRK